MPNAPRVAAGQIDLVIRGRELNTPMTSPRESRVIEAAGGHSLTEPGAAGRRRRGGRGRGGGRTGAVLGT